MCASSMAMMLRLSGHIATVPFYSWYLPTLSEFDIWIFHWWSSLRGFGMRVSTRLGEKSGQTIQRLAWIWDFWNLEIAETALNTMGLHVFLFLDNMWNKKVFRKLTLELMTDGPLVWCDKSDCLWCLSAYQNPLPPSLSQNQKCRPTIPCCLGTDRHKQPKFVSSTTSFHSRLLARAQLPFRYWKVLVLFYQFKHHCFPSHLSRCTDCGVNISWMDHLRRPSIINFPVFIVIFSTISDSSLPTSSLNKNYHLPNPVTLFCTGCYSWRCTLRSHHHWYCIYE